LLLNAPKSVGIRPRRVSNISSSPSAEKTVVQDGKQAGGKSKFSLTLISVLFICLIDWMKPTPRGENNMLYSVY
jgi:hypothetical protein